MNQPVVYKITNLINKKIYVGRNVNNNPNYFGSGVLILLAIEKYGLENFSREILEYCTRENLDEREIFWIKELNSQDRQIGYNIADGGHNFFTMNEEIKAKISKTLKGKFVGTDAFRHKISLSEEHRQRFLDGYAFKIKGKTIEEVFGKEEANKRSEKISNAQIEYWKIPEYRKKMSKAISEGKTGTTLTKEHRENIGNGLKGRPVSEETREKLKNSNINKKQKHSISVIAINSKSGEELSFNNISHAARILSTTFYNIKQNKLKDFNITLIK